MKTQSYIDYLEAHLGPIRRRFSARPGSPEASVGLLAFDESPFPEATTLVTCGLSHHVVEQERGQQIRQEFVMCGFSERISSGFANVLDRVASQFLELHQPVKRGQVIGPRGPLVKGATVEALVCATPWYWKDSFSCFEQVVPPVVMVWLVPVTREESCFINLHGLDAFEQIVDDEEIDLLDLKRESANFVLETELGCS